MNMNGTDLQIGDIIATYRYFWAFDLRHAEEKSTVLPPDQNRAWTLDEGLPRSILSKRWARGLLTTKRDSRPDIQGQLIETANEFREQMRLAPAFPPHAQEYWLSHPNRFKPSGVAGYAPSRACGTT